MEPTEELLGSSSVHAQTVRPSSSEGAFPRLVQVGLEVTASSSRGQLKGRQGLEIAARGI